MEVVLRTVASGGGIGNSSSGGGNVDGIDTCCHSDDGIGNSKGDRGSVGARNEYWDIDAGRVGSPGGGEYCCDSGYGIGNGGSGDSGCVCCGDGGCVDEIVLIWIVEGFDY